MQGTQKMWTLEAHLIMNVIVLQSKQNLCQRQAHLKKKEEVCQVNMKSNLPLSTKYINII